VTSSKDTALRPLREIGRWQTVVRSLPLVAHWLDGSPIEHGVRVIARLEYRYRGFMVDGTPVASEISCVPWTWMTRRHSPARSTRPPQRPSSRGTAPRSLPTGTASPRPRPE
jgi:hypothetical protein